MRSSPLYGFWLRLLFSIGVAGALGFGFGMSMVDQAAADIQPPDVDGYTYGDGSCSAAVRKDPVTVVFINHGTSDAIQNYAVDHGGWTFQGGTQYFKDENVKVENGCHPSDGSPASRNGFFSGRYHMRHYNLRDPAGGIRTDPPFGSVSLASPHHEDLVTCGIEPSHVPDDNGEQIYIEGLNIYADGGFNAGREDIKKNWVFYGDHNLQDQLFWGNTQVMDQCNGNEVSSNGIVYYIKTFHYDPDDTDADGCDNVKENGSDPTMGGLRNPANRWDFYDVSLPTDGEIDLFTDILGVIWHYSLDGGPPYDAYYDRGPAPQGANVWEMTAPNGIIDLFTDILGVLMQYSHDCT